jgi:hypothetical protein
LKSTQKIAAAYYVKQRELSDPTQSLLFLFLGQGKGKAKIALSHWDLFD